MQDPLLSSPSHGGAEDTDAKKKKKSHVQPLPCTDSAARETEAQPTGHPKLSYTGLEEVRRQHRGPWQAAPCGDRPPPHPTTSQATGQQEDPYLTEGGRRRGARRWRRRGRRDRHPGPAPGGSGCSVLGASLVTHACGKGGSGQGLEGKAGEPATEKHGPGLVC